MEGLCVLVPKKDKKKMSIFEKCKGLIPTLKELLSYSTWFAITHKQVW